jgi:hypothetical protein
MVDPEDWPPPRGTTEAVVSGAVLPGNSISIKTAAARVRVYLTPDMIDFSQRAQVRVNGSVLNREPFVEPDLALMLEDVRTRGDRQHPFWAVVETPASRTARASRP